MALVDMGLVRCADID